jgi:hypothetical protein
VTVKNKIVAVFAILFWIWYINPLPEGQIALALLTGGTVTLSTGNWQTSLLTFMVTFRSVNWFMETYVIPKIKLPRILRGT